MFGFQGDRLVHVSLPILEGLARQSRDEIKADILKAGLAQHSKRGSGIVGVMASGKEFEMCVVESLDAKARTVDTEGTVLRE
jgi:hypothetical protein